MDGYQFEEQCAIILKRKHFSKIEVTKSSGDQGVDIIAYKHRKKYGIQCKYYTYPVGNKAVQDSQPTGWLASSMMRTNFSGTKDAPPIRPPSISGWASSSKAFFSFMEPP